MVQISNVIKYKLKFLVLTKAGMIHLTPFEDKILYKALSLFQRAHHTMPDLPFNYYYSYCIYESQRLKLEPNWVILQSFYSFDSKSDVTMHGEKLDLKLCRRIIEHKSQRQKSRTWQPIDEWRRDLSMNEELIKAIESGNINHKGLKLLRSFFMSKEKLITIIDAYLDKT